VVSGIIKDCYPPLKKKRKMIAGRLGAKRRIMGNS
jgi:hypothetical protein